MGTDWNDIFNDPAKSCDCERISITVVTGLIYFFFIVVSFLRKKLWEII